MPAALTHSSILLLARRRLRRLYGDLEAKARAAGPLSDLELRLAHLARRAHEMVSTPPWPELPAGAAGDELAAGVSKFAVLGSMGPDVPAFAALLAPGQGWIFDTVHKGNPDFNREAVRARTTDLALAIWERGAAAVAAEVTDPAARERALSYLRAYVLGHLAHLAGDILAHPYVHAVEWNRGTTFDHAATEGAIDARVARQVLGRAGTREGERWDAWWPAPDEVPPQLPAAYAAALEQVYALRTRRPTGFAEFEAEYARHDPPPLDDGLIADGFKVFRLGAIGIAYGWGWEHWFGFLSLLAVPLLALPPLALAAPRSSVLFGAAGPGVTGEEEWSELLTLPLALTAPFAWTAAFAAASLTTRGVERYAAAGLVSTGLATALGIAFLGEALGGTRLSPALRWLLLFGVPAAIGLVHATRLKRPRVGLLPLVHLLPLAVLALFFLFVGLDRLCRLVFPDGVAQAISLAVWTAALVVLWIWAAKRLRDIRIPEQPQEFPADLPHHVRLFDATTLFHEPAAPEPSLADLFYPAGPSMRHRRPERHKLLELWWTGGGDLWVRSEGYQLAFSADGTTAAQTVRAPIEPLTAKQYVDLLAAAVPGLLGRVAAPGDPDYVLPPGFTFALGEKDGEKDPPPPGDAAGKFLKLGSSAGQPTPIYHAPKSAQAARFGVHGPVDARDYTTGAKGDDDGFLFVHDPLAGGDGATVMDLAADFSALLMLGGASHLLPAADRAVAGASPVAAIQQVFRNWSLDRRRVNEWRLLVAGGALSEKGAAPGGVDPLMPAATPAGWTSPLAGDALAEGERTARAVGWVPLLRKWQDAARRPGVDVTADQPLDPNDPSRRALSRALAFLLDMPDPVKVR
jgi:zinc dependent phospholipase C